MWTFPVPIPSRIPSTPWKTDTRTAGPGLPSSFSFMSAQRRPHNSGAVRHLQQEHPPGCSFFCPHRPTPAARMRRPRTGRARLKREDTRTRAANARCARRCLRTGPGPLPRMPSPPRLPERSPAPYRSHNILALSSCSRPRPLLPRGSGLPGQPASSGLRPLSPRARIAFCPCPAAGTGAPVRPRAPASTVPAGDAAQTLPRIIP